MTKVPSTNDVKIQPKKRRFIKYFLGLLIILILGFLFLYKSENVTYHDLRTFNFLEKKPESPKIYTNTCPEVKTVEICSNYDSLVLKMLHNFLQLKNTIEYGEDYNEELTNFKDSLDKPESFKDELEKFEQYRRANISTKGILESNFERVKFDILSTEIHKANGETYKGVFTSFINKFIKIRSTKLEQHGETYSPENKVELVVRALKNDDFIAAKTAINLFDASTRQNHKDILDAIAARGELQEALDDAEFKLNELITNRNR